MRVSLQHFPLASQEELLEDKAVAIVFQCECGKQFETREEDAGRRARCPAWRRELEAVTPP